MTDERDESTIEVDSTIVSTEPLYEARTYADLTASNLSRALASGSFVVGDRQIECAVLEGPTRVLTQRGMFVALGRHKNPSKGQTHADDRPGFLNAKKLEPFISDRLRGLWSPIPFYGQGGYRGNINFGYRAEIIPLVCSVYINADAAGVLYHENEKAIARRCRELQEAFAVLGIVGLVDEVTGYRELSAKDELQKILAAYIEPEFLPWTKRFPDEFYREMFRLWDWQYTPLSVKRPKFVAHLTSKLVYEKLPPGVVEKLRQLNPADDEGRRKRRHHQFLTEDIGSPHLERHLAVVTMLMKISPNKRAFERNFARAFPSPALGQGATQLALAPGLVEEDEDDFALDD